MGLDRVEMTFVARASTPRQVRAFVGEALDAMGADATTVADFRLAASELAANAVEHGRPDASLTVEVDATSPDWWTMEVHLPADGWLPHAPQTWQVATPAAAAGRGLGIVRALMDDVSVELAGPTVTLGCRRRRGEPS